MAVSVTPSEMAPLDSDEIAGAPTYSFWADARRRFLRNKLAVGSVIFVLLLTLIAIFAPLIAPYGYNDQFVGPSSGPMSSKFWFGTDNLGRDQLSRIIFGARYSLSIGLAVVLLSTLLSIFIGGMAGYFGGKVDAVLMRFADCFLALPYILLAFAMVETFGRSFLVVVLSLVIRGWMSGARTFRASVLQVKSLDYVEAARATGAGNDRILWSHIFPNAAQILIVGIGLSVGAAILTESVYSFLGVGFQEPTPAWGILVDQGRGAITSKPHLFFWPAAALMVTVLAFMFIAEGVRDAFDPKLR